MGHPPPNIRDVARAANISVASVSRVFSGKGGVGQETRARILQVAARLGYRPNLAARGLARGRTGNVAVVTPRGSALVFSNPFFIRILDGVGRGLDPDHYNLVLAFTPQQYLRLIETRAVDGLLLFAARIGDPHLERLEQSGLPVVAVGSYRPEAPFVCVRPDDAGGISMMVRHLHRLGHRRIALVNGPLTSIKSVRCRDGFVQAAAELGLPVGGALLEAEEFDQDASYRLVRELLRARRQRPTALVCASDYLAVGVVKAVQDSGLAVPEDVSVTGFGDVPLSSYLNPPLTTARTDLVGIGTQGARLLMKLLEGKKPRKKDHVFAMELVERATTAPPSAGPRAEPVEARRGRGASAGTVLPAP